MNNKIKSIRKWMQMSIPVLFALLCSLGTAIAQNDPNTRTLIFHAGISTFATGKTPGAYTDENKTFTVTNVGIGEDSLIRAYAPAFDLKPSMKLPKYSINDNRRGFITNVTPLPSGTGAYDIYVLWNNITAEDFRVTLPDDLTYTGTSKVVSVVCKTDNAGKITVKYKRLPDGTPSEEAPSVSGNYQIIIDMAASGINTPIEGLSLGMMSIEKAPQTPPSGIEGVNTSGANNGKIIHVTDKMEYRSIDSTNYIGITGDEVTSLPSGIYYVRLKERENHKPSANVTITIAKGQTQLFTVTYMTDDETSYLEQFIYDGSLTTLPNPAPTKSGYTFDTWVTTKGGSTVFNFGSKITANTTLYAKWKANPTYSIEGQVTEEAEVSIHPLGISAKTKADSTFTISGIPAGSYNLIAVNKNGNSVTQFITVTDNLQITELIQINGKSNSELVVETGAPGILVDKLDKLATAEQGGSEDNVWIKLMASPKTGEDTDTETNTIREQMSGDNMDLASILNLTLTKTVNNGEPDTLSSLSQLIDVIIPFPETMRSNTNFILYRYHAGQVDKITTKANTDGEKLVVAESGSYIIATLKKFSTYALGTNRMFTVNYMLDELTIFKTVPVAEGSKTEAPKPAPSKNGYALNGWYKELACTNAWKFDTDIVNSNLSLYPKWDVATPPTPSYYYDINGKVTDENGTPLIHAKVQLLNQNDKVLEETYTNNTGYYFFVSQNIGTYRLFVSHESYQSNRVPDFYLDTNTTHNIILQSVSTGLDTVNKSDIRVYGSTASLVIETEAGKSYRIIGLSGSLVDSGITTDSRTTIPVVTGIYIVIIDKQNYKVIVR